MGKRPAPAISSKGPNKKRKVGETKKEKAADRPIIPIPEFDSDDDDISDQDQDLLEQYGRSVSFLSNLDKGAISRSKKETARLKQIGKPSKQPTLTKDDDLPSIDSNSEDDQDEEEEEEEEEWDSHYSDDSDSDEEMPYEKLPRVRNDLQEKKSNAPVKGLPIKLANGSIQHTGKAVIIDKEEDEPPSDSDSEPEERERSPPTEDVSTAARFGRPAVVDVLLVGSKSKRIQAAKEQIAGICQDIVSDPENGLGLLRRLHTFSLPTVKTPSHPDGVPNDLTIRKLALLSQLAVFKDIVPGYRIRELTEKEKAEKVSQMVARTREYEQGLVHVYQTYLKSLESEIKSRTELALICLQSMCTLLKDLTHFNFRINLMGCIVSKLSKKSWDDTSQMCLDTIIHVFRNDRVGLPSLELVQLLNRMIKERHYHVHPFVLSSLLHLRLRNELGVRASDARADKEAKAPLNKKKKVKGKEGAQPHLSKKAKKVLKEHKEIEKEFKEAEAQVDKEERANRQTETLKLLFVLYFQILKNPKPTPLLPAALRGISRFAHLVNVDFFKDLLKVLKELVNRESDTEDDETDSPLREANQVQHRLLCIVTAFELLSGQGDALTIDLSDFVTSLYGLILPLSIIPTIDSTSETIPESTADLLFRALELAFSSQTAANVSPSWRSAAFAKRLLIASLQWPGPVSARAVEFVTTLVAKDRKLEGLLSTEDRSFDGVYRPDVDDPQLSNPFVSCFWELQTLKQSYDARVRASAVALANFER